MKELSIEIEQENKDENKTIKEAKRILLESTDPKERAEAVRIIRELSRNLPEDWETAPTKEVVPPHRHVFSWFDLFLILLWVISLMVLL